MQSEQVKNFFLNKLRHPNQNSVRRGLLAIHLPIHENLVNFSILSLIASSEGMRDLRSITFSELEGNKFLVQINHRKLNKTLRCKINEIGFLPNSDAYVEIDFIEGIRFYEKLALKSALAFQRGWEWFKSGLHDSNELTVKKTSAFQMSSNGIIINMTKTLREQGLDYLVPLIEWKNISTFKNKLIIDFNLKI